MATIDSAKVLGIDRLVGLVEVGKRVDLIVIDPNKINMAPVYDVESSIVNTLDSSNIKMSIVNGKIIYQDGKYLTIDKDKIIKDFLDLTKEIKEFID